MAMAILSDEDLMQGMMTGTIGISDFSERGLTPNGYDLRIAQISIMGDPKTKEEGIATIPPKTMFYVSTIERIRMPDDLCASLWMRTSWIRKGIIGAFGKIDAGFEGTLTLGGYNASDNPVDIPIWERFCQMVFETLSSASLKNYAKRSGHYQGQSGITLDPIKKE
jgi:dCTP deaminase